MNEITFIKLSIKIIFSILFLSFTVFSLNIKNTINLGIITKEFSDNDVALLYQLKCQNQIAPFNNSIVWMYNNSEILPQNIKDNTKTTILISNITEKDTGLYDCCVLDTDNRYICYRQTLRVLRKLPTLAIDMRINNNMVILKNSNVYLWLFNDTYSNINCTLNNQILPSNINLSITSVPQDISIEYRDMFINKTREENTGNYSCLGIGNNKRVNISFYLKINSVSLKAKNPFIIVVIFFFISFFIFNFNNI
ncbi:Immunoglobulin-like domain and Immunoglobulin-like fold domain-containing protein [Strongyloides ratti]|uniref:Immunoglobulin-like domain and Immunoglobulin-like fold domain-containing protein n=1 Tax=Strongyloides ratti TaxID=34506 RepID=A0A090MNE2_STRRB|nr:Immunoglobulin-like domain and Immunoglobulin-like fold domain-containing protein [Strongyloides ratti]CEF59591.1 Immunoglobulin-like domain and Immunoglobulin-like fold domain-containing protein [Strongyloides ratti]